MLLPHLMIQQVTYNQSLQCQLAQALTRQHWHLKCIGNLIALL